MKIEWNKKYTTIAVYVCIVITFGALIAFSIFNLGTIWSAVKKVISIFNPIIYGFVIAFLLNPIFRLFDRRVFAFVSKKKDRDTLRRVLALICTYLVVLIFISGFIMIAVPQIASGFSDLQSKMSGYITTTQDWVKNTLGGLRSKHGQNLLFKFIDVDQLVGKINEFINNSYKLLSNVVPYVTDFITSLINVVKNMFLGIVISLYFLFSRDKLCAQIKKTAYAIFKRETTDKMLYYTRYTSHKFESFISGKVVDSIIIGILTFIILSIFGIPYPALIATIVGVTNIIPFFGPIIGAIPSAFIVFVASPVKTIWFIIIILVIQQLDGNVIGPLILGDRIGLSALWIVISLLLMGGMLGITGMFIGVPLFAVIYGLFAAFVEKRLNKKGLPVDTEDYFIKPDEEYHRPKYTPKSIVHMKNLFSKIKNKVSKKSKKK